VAAHRTGKYLYYSNNCEEYIMIFTAWQVYIILPMAIIGLTAITRELARKRRLYRVAGWDSVFIAILWLFYVASYVRTGVEGQAIFPETPDYWLVGGFLAAFSGIFMFSLIERLRP
jgi:hypothetical protein